MKVIVEAIVGAILILTAVGLAIAILTVSLNPTLWWVVGIAGVTGLFLVE